MGLLIGEMIYPAAVPKRIGRLCGVIALPARQTGVRRNGRIMYSVHTRMGKSVWMRQRGITHSLAGV